MSPPQRKPDTPRKIIPFPRRFTVSPADLLADSLDSGGMPLGLEEIWSQELDQLAQEPGSAPLRLVTDLDSGRSLLEFLETTGLRALVQVKEVDGDLAILSSKPTVSRLVVWQALDLGLAFSVKPES